MVTDLSPEPLNYGMEAAATNWKTHASLLTSLVHGRHVDGSHEWHRLHVDSVPKWKLASNDLDIEVRPNSDECESGVWHPQLSRIKV